MYNKTKWPPHQMAFETSDHARRVLQELRRQQQQSVDMCDVILLADDHNGIPAHRCILAACSQYFRTMFDSDFSDKLCREFIIPNASYASLDKIVHFMYTGKIQIDFHEVEEILTIADYLCIENLNDYCEQILHNNLNENNCLFIKHLADRYNMACLGGELTHYIIPKMSKLLDQIEVLELPFYFIWKLLQNSSFNYIREQDLFKFIVKWVNYDLPHRSAHFKDLFKCIQMSYMSENFILEEFLQEPLVTAHIDNTILETINKEALSSRARHVYDVIICRSRNVSIGGEVQVLCYHIRGDQWFTLKLPRPHALDGLESMIRHLGCIFFLTSITEDMYGYMHHAQESKHFWKLDLSTGAWSELQPPKHVKANSRLVPCMDRIYVIDRAGLVEGYDLHNNRWTTNQIPGHFEVPNSTCYILPMPIDRYIYILRVFSAGYSFAYAQQSFSLHLYDAASATWEDLSEIEAGEVDLLDEDKLHGYTAAPGSLTMKNELGEPRLVYDLTEKTWRSVASKKALPTFLTDVWGVTEWMDRVYFVGKTEDDPSLFMSYDYGRKRFKALKAPPMCISGLLTNVRLKKEILDFMIQR